MYPEGRDSDVHQQIIYDRKQRATETVAEYLDNLRKMVWAAYPNLPEEAREQILKPIFIRGNKINNNHSLESPNPAEDWDYECCQPKAKPEGSNAAAKKEADHPLAIHRFPMILTEEEEELLLLKELGNLETTSTTAMEVEQKSCRSIANVIDNKIPVQ
uniref:Retrotransposon gag domain-containing protein n=1 Tax=Romanomermis culicivorax TaxID=13658 RepID=A0A915KSW9_ROMCU